MKNENVKNKDKPKSPRGGKWLSRLFLLCSAGLLLYVSLLCYPHWPYAMLQAIEHPRNTAAYHAFSDFTKRLQEGDGVLSAFSESYKLIYEQPPAD